MKKINEKELISELKSVTDDVKTKSLLDAELKLKRIINILKNDETLSFKKKEIISDREF